VNAPEDFRAKLGIQLVYFSMGALVLLAGTMVVGGIYVDKGANFFQLTQLLLTSLLPLFGTWVGTVLAFYFGKANYEAASQSTLDAVNSVSKRLASTAIVDAMMPRGKMITFDLAAGQELKDIAVKAVAAKFDNVGANGQRISRLPILDSSGKFAAFLHRSVWTEMLASALSQPGQAFDFNTATLQPMLAANYPLATGKTYAEFIASAAAFVPRDGKMADAKARMESVSGCQDVLVTEHGLPGETVIGWISNIDIGRLSQA